MKPQPRPRRAVTVPKAVGPDPAALTAPGVSQANAASSTDTASRSRNAQMKQLNIRVPVELAGRARTAWRVLMAHDAGQPYSTFGGWIGYVLEQAVIDAEECYNDGKPFDGTSPGQLPLGRAPS